MRNLFELKDKQLILFKVCLIAIPSYLVAFLTERIVYVVPTIAMMLMISNSIELGNSSNRNRIEDEGPENDDGDGDGDGISGGEAGL